MFASLQYDVFCHICGWRYLEQDPAVRFIHAEHVWECADEAECFGRRAAGRPGNGGAL